MKSKLIIAIIVLLQLGVSAQNLQLHYDFGSDRKYLTSTLEMFKPDKWGNTFYFVDIDYGNTEHHQPSLAYMEIARCLKFWQMPLSIHVEYDGGLGTFKVPGQNISGFYLNNSYLLGVDYSINNADFTRTFSIKALYKYIQNKQNSAQLTAVWGMHFFNRKLSFTGFADFWLEKNSVNNTSTIFLTEPQLWYNITTNLSAGGEIEFSNNFANYDGFKVRPTLALKWNF